jgi:hypothetical protein
MTRLAFYTALGYKLRFFKGGKAQFVTVGIICKGRQMEKHAQRFDSSWPWLKGWGA